MKQNNNLAFSPDSDMYARRGAATYARDMFYAYLQGQEKAYSVNDAISELEACFGEGAEQAIKLVRQAMKTESEAARRALMTKAVDLIDRAVRRD